MNNNDNDDADNNNNNNSSSACLARILVFCNDVNDDDWFCTIVINYQFVDLPIYLFHSILYQSLSDFFLFVKWKSKSFQNEPCQHSSRHCRHLVIAPDLWLTMLNRRRKKDCTQYLVHNAKQKKKDRLHQIFGTQC